MGNKKKASLKNPTVLKESPLLQAVVAPLPPAGTLVWAKNGGSVYWPGFITSPKKDTDDEQFLVNPEEYAFVVFLEKRFRVGAISWDRVILIDEGKNKQQTELVTDLNRTVKKGWSPDPRYKEGIHLLDEFVTLNPAKREEYAVTMYNCSVEQKVDDKTRCTSPTSKDSVKDKGTPSNGMITSKKGKSCSLSKKRHDHERYEFRKTALPVKKQVEPTVVNSKKNKDVANISKTDVNNNTNNAGNGIVPVVNMKNKKTGRPLHGGELLKEWTKEQFNKIDKKYVFESSGDPACSYCKEKIKETPTLCHDYPFHKKCLIETAAGTSNEDGQPKILFKCHDCTEKRCFLCKEVDNAVKCSKCTLSFHRDCLKLWPQATVQGIDGPITCPLHFCHTCKAEERCLSRMRNYKLTNTKAYRCIHCLSSYHKAAGCLPAGCGASVTGNSYIECPKHFNKTIGLKRSRRLGCFACNKRLLDKEEHAECRTCYMIFHPACIGYTDEERNDGITLSEFARNFQCNTCCWGLFPLYGQVVWFQQPGSSFWPARILYPKESAVRNKETVGCYSVVYFGSQPSYFDIVTQAVPFHITELEFLTKLNLYNEKPVLLTAYEEAGYCLNLSEASRDSLLPKPEPDYKKIERNSYRNTFGFGKRSDSTKGGRPSQELVCNCGKLTDGNACAVNVGCYNRDASVECHPSICSAPDQCRNRMFSQPNNYDYLESFTTNKKGWGVKTKKNIAEGDFIIEYVGEVISRHDMSWRASRKTEEDPLYILDLGSNLFIDAEYAGNISRLINHSCQPNCITEKYISLNRPVVGVFAAREIEAGEELTFNYAYGKTSTAPVKCHCNTECCKGYIGRKVLENDEENLKPSVKRKRSMDEEITKPEADDEWNNNCEVCTFGGHVILCDFDNCRKVFHLKCAGLKKAPRGSWICPTHMSSSVRKKRKLEAVTTSPGESSKLSEVMDVNIFTPVTSKSRCKSLSTKRKPKSKQEFKSCTRTPSKSLSTSRNRTLKSLNAPVEQ